MSEVRSGRPRGGASSLPEIVVSLPFCVASFRATGAVCVYPSCPRTARGVGAVPVCLRPARTPALPGPPPLLPADAPVLTVNTATASRSGSPLTFLGL